MLVTSKTDDKTTTYAWPLTSARLDHHGAEGVVVIVLKEFCWGHLYFCLGKGSGSSSVNPRRVAKGSQNTYTNRRAKCVVVNKQHLANRGLCWVLPGKGRRERLGDSELQISTVRLSAYLHFFLISTDAVAGNGAALQ